LTDITSVLKARKIQIAFEDLVTIRLFIDAVTVAEVFVSYNGI